MSATWVVRVPQLPASKSRVNPVLVCPEFIYLLVYTHLLSVPAPAPLTISQNPLFPVSHFLPQFIGHFYRGVVLIRDSCYKNISLLHDRVLKFISVDSLKTYL